jgi:carbon monoxide dehydrogenase subunit G
MVPARWGRRQRLSRPGTVYPEARKYEYTNDAIIRNDAIRGISGMRVDGAFEIDIPRETLFRSITDPALMAVCVPGCESIERLDATTYRAVVKVALGVIKARFNLVVEVTAEIPPERVQSVTRGEEGGRASQLTATNEVLLVDLGGGRTRVEYQSDLSVTGRFGKFALGMMKKKAQSMAQEFANNLRARIVAASAPDGAAAPVT